MKRNIKTKQRNRTVEEFKLNVLTALNIIQSSTIPYEEAGVYGVKASDKIHMLVVTHAECAEDLKMILRNDMSAVDVDASIMASDVLRHLKSVGAGTDVEIFPNYTKQLEHSSRRSYYGIAIDILRFCYEQKEQAEPNQHIILINLLLVIKCFLRSICGLQSYYDTIGDLWELVQDLGIFKSISSKDMAVIIQYSNEPPKKEECTDSVMQMVWNVTQQCCEVVNAFNNVIGLPTYVFDDNTAVFDDYCAKQGIHHFDDMYAELLRLVQLVGSYEMEDIQKYIKENLL